MDTQLRFVKDEAGRFWVFGRSLCRLISGYTDPDRDFTNWIKLRASAYRPNVDYQLISRLPRQLTPGTHSRVLVEYLISLPMAKSLITDGKSADSSILIQLEEFNPETTPVTILPAGLVQSIQAHTTSKPESNKALLDQQQPEAAPRDQATPAHVQFAPVEQVVPQSRVQQLLAEQQRIQLDIQQAVAEEQDKQTTTNSGEQWLATDQRIRTLETRCDLLIDVLRQVATTLLSGLPANVQIDAADPLLSADFSAEPVDSAQASVNSPRRQLIQIVADYSQATHQAYKVTWGYLYTQLHIVHHFNVSRKQPKENYLDFAERSGQLDNLLSIAQAQLHVQSEVTA